MVTNITSLTGNGLKDWLLQRFSALYFACYFVFIFIFFLSHPRMHYADWHGLFQGWGFKIASIIALLAFTIHAWIGLWTVLTDYVKKTSLRLVIEGLVFLGLLGQLLWGIIIIWG